MERRTFSTKALPKKNRGKKANKGRAKNAGGAGLGPRPAKLQRNEVVERGIPGFKALRYRAKLSYYDQLSLTTGAGVAGTYVYSANGLYDPDITSTGHQPMPFDQLMLSFEHYCVVGAKMTCNFKNASTTNTIGIGISLNAGPSAITSVQQIVENGVMVRDRLPVAPSSETLKTLSIPTSIAKFGSVRDLLDNPDYNGSVAANPVEQSYFHISVWCPDSLSLVSGITVEVYIEYDAWFFEPRKNSVSVNQVIHKLLIEEQKSEQKSKPKLEDFVCIHSPSVEEEIESLQFQLTRLRALAPSKDPAVLSLSLTR